MDPVVTGGLIGVGGTLLGVAAQDGLARLRARRDRKRESRRAVTAIVGELIATVSILDKALERGAWWPDGDEPRREEWDRYRDSLAEELDTETIMRVGIVYDAIRSLAATRSSPLAPARGRLGRATRNDPERRSFLSLVWTNDRWPWAAEETQRTRAEVWTLLTETLWPLQRRLLKRGEEEPWQLPEAAGPISGRPRLLLAPNGVEWKEGRAEYEALVAALADAGLDPSIQEPRDGMYAQGGIVTDPTIDLTIFLWEEVPEQVVEEVVALATENLRRMTTRQRQGVVHLFGGDMMSFELPADEDGSG